MKSSLCCLAKNRAYVAMIFTQFIYAGMALLSKAAIAKGMNPYVFVVYRQAFASLALSPFAFFDRKQGAPLSYNLLSKIFLVSLVGVTLSSNLYYVAINYTSATFAAATTTTIPAITFIMAVTIRVESISMKHIHGIAKILGSILSLSGAVIFALIKGPSIGFKNWHPSITTPHSNGDQVKGVIMMLSANTAWSLWLILQGFIVKEYPAKFRLTTLQCFFSCIQTVVLAVTVERDPSAWKLGWDIHLLSVAYCGVIVAAITYWLQVCTVEEKGAVFTAMFTPLSLVITAFFSVLFWRESLHWGSVGGTILLIIGLYSVLWGKNRETEKVQNHEKTQPPKDHYLDTTLELSSQI
ncbi:hypothetical protein K1719_025187 [Acacia pycnantha]|nr:hypothetical protein K1719_025187 [Acacia pycnantha]